MKDVAARAGVSVSTVSRVLNGGKASDAVMRRVEEAVRELGYRVNVTARGLKQRISDIVGVIVADISNPPISAMFDGICRSLNERGMTVMLGNSEAEERNELDFLRLFADERARGVIYTGKRISSDLATALNTYPGKVVVATQEHPNLRWPVVLFDNYGASLEVLRRLTDHGHRRIAFISGPLEDEQAGRARLRGYYDGLDRVGVTPDEAYIRQADFSVSSGYEAMTRILTQSEVPPTAVYAGSDLIAIGALRCLQERGIRVPEEVSVFGFDNIPVSSKMIPSLSTVELDFGELGEVCGDLLGRMFGRERTHVDRVVLSHTVITRESVADRPKRSRHPRST